MTPGTQMAGADPAEPLVAERLRVRVLEAPVSDAVPMSFGRLTARRVCLVEVHAGGLVGIGESWLNYPHWGPAERIATFCDGVAELVLGRDVRDPVATWSTVAETLLPLGRQWGAPGPVWQAISGLDLALWDLAGKANGQPVAGLLLPNGTPRRSVPAYGSGVGPTLVAELTERALRLGLTAVKLKVGFGRESDEASVATVRQVAGDTLRIFADANQAWDLATATEMCRMFASYGVEWVEEPLAGDDLAALEKLAMDAEMPLANGENLYGFEEFARYTTSPAIAQIQPDVAKTGGLTLARDVASLAGENATKVSPHCYSGPVAIAASLQLGAASTAVEWIELDLRHNPLRTDLLSRPLVLDEGDLVVPEGAGLGIEIDPVVAGRYQVYDRERSTT